MCARARQFQNHSICVYCPNPILRYRILKSFERERERVEIFEISNLKAYREIFSISNYWIFEITAIYKERKNEKKNVKNERKMKVFVLSMMMIVTINASTCLNGPCAPGNDFCGVPFENAPTFHLMSQHGCGENDPNGPYVFFNPHSYSLKSSILSTFNLHI